MKKILSILFAATLLFASCNKNQMANKKLDGTWKITTFNSVAVPSNYSIATITFDAAKKGTGTGNTHIALSQVYGIITVTVDIVQEFTYTISEKATKITTTTTKTTTTVGGVATVDATAKSAETVTITDHSKTKITTTDKDGKIMIIEK